ncbi:ligand-binding sensor domain-containing diguanylate cyclase [Alteromonas gilva]|uniref:diguanylate cyclase n=1 Tax=Alteromonas gilva TaxID=2987522 RepID=A0ABT5L2G0_9ALTE|nr:ligand-binding sensor domain-containing diguanylate cyclase [Alteromonas gilva]MDC8830666.1 diguanylate cyclase [Alteromonas gilva]
MQAAEPDWHKFSQPVFHVPLGASPLAEGPIGSVTEDNSGFIWLVAANGLWRWDSHTLVKANIEPYTFFNTTPQAKVVFTGTEGEVWLGTNQGLYQLQHGSMLFRPVAPELLGGISVKRGIAATINNHQIMVIAADRALYQFDIKQQQMLPIELPAGERIHAIHIDTANTLWVGTSHGLYRARANNTKFGPLQLESGFPATTRVSTISTTTSGLLTVGTAADGLFVKPPGQSFKNVALNTATPVWIFATTEIRPDVLLLGTFGDGLIEVNLSADPTQPSLRYYRHNRQQPARLTDNNIWILFTDSRGRVWIGAGGALNLLDAGNTGVQHVLAGSGQPGSLQRRKVLSVQAFNNQIVVGSGTQGIEVLTAQDGNIGNLWPDSVDPVETLYAGHNATLYASANFATVKMSPPHYTATPLQITGRPPNAFTSAFADTSQTLWLGGTDGLWQISRAEQTTTEIFANVSGERRIASLLAADKVLWIGTWQGLMRGDIDSTGQLVTRSITLVNQPVLRQQYISDLFVDKHNQLWVSTSGAGLFVLDRSGNWQQLTSADGLPGDAVKAIGGESTGLIWVGTSRGIAAIHAINHQVNSVVTGQQAVNSPYSGAAATQTPRGTIIFGGSAGLTIIHPEIIDNTNVNQPLPLVFTRINAVTAEGLQYSPLINHNQPFSVEPLPKRITFEFTALQYINPEQVVYRYRLQGRDENWTYTDAEHRVITLTTPDPGDYTLAVQYSLDGKNWSADTRLQTFNVQPAWYQTNTAKVAIVVLVLVIIFALHQLGLRHYRYRQAVLERRVAARTAELEAANIKLSQQAVALKQASLTDPLTGLNNRRFLDQNIERDITRLQRYYSDCRQHQTAPKDTADILFFIIDLDHFKVINDTFGHQAGDAVLVETKQRLAHIFRETDYLIRWGGEEFLVVTHETPREEAEALAERIVEVMNACEMSINETTEIDVTCSVGFAAYPLDKQRVDALSWQTTIAIADAALYGAKNNNRNTWLGVTSLDPGITDTTLQQIKQQPSNIFKHAPVLRRY